MSNYTIVTNYVAKDALISGNPLKLVKGADFTTEFTAVQTALNTKIDGVVQFAPDGTFTQPSYGFTNNAGVGMYNTAGVLGFATNALARGTISTAGNWTVNAPASGVALAITGFSGSSVMTATPAGATDYGLTVLAATAGNSAIQLQINAAAQGLLGVSGAAGQLIAGSVLNDVCIRAINGAIRFAGSASSSTQLLLDTTGTLNLANGTGAIVGPVYSGLPQTARTVSYAPILTDNGKHIYFTVTGQNFIIPANSGTAFPIGAAFTVVNASGVTTALQITTDTLIWSPSGTAGARTLAPFGVATFLKLTATSWTVTGTGIT